MYILFQKIEIKNRISRFYRKNKCYCEQGVLKIVKGMKNYFFNISNTLRKKIHIDKIKKRRFTCAQLLNVYSL